ncbi:MAG: hypothetical protein QNK05_20935 [Myxococcota bacterium]|nr:hypothetical protein [Myxococcota bacterium]
MHTPPVDPRETDPRRVELGPESRSESGSASRRDSGRDSGSESGSQSGSECALELGMVLVAFFAIGALLPLFGVALRSLGAFGLGVLGTIVIPLGLGWLWLLRRGSFG